MVAILKLKRGAHRAELRSKQNSGVVAQSALQRQWQCQRPMQKTFAREFIVLNLA
ncbi:hypothetical protein [Trichocoleus desertorum]|uniref:Uncharacterized protein n=1 Tax=Trichocoleus desertorum GB2-A4 TaxID=2933944 RepID=A0ABV0J3U8_9CYAN